MFADESDDDVVFEDVKAGLIDRTAPEIDAARAVKCEFDTPGGSGIVPETQAVAAVPALPSPASPPADVFNATSFDGAIVPFVSTTKVPNTERDAFDTPSFDTTPSQDTHMAIVAAVLESEERVFDPVSEQQVLLLRRLGVAPNLIANLRGKREASLVITDALNAVRERRAQRAAAVLAQTTAQRA